MYAAVEHMLLKNKKRQDHVVKMYPLCWEAISLHNTFIPVNLKITFPLWAHLCFNKCFLLAEMIFFFVFTLQTEISFPCFSKGHLSKGLFGRIEIQST